jgi:hypothetical protein
MEKSIGSYKAHQELIQRFKRVSIKEIPNLHLFDRHVGLFFTQRLSKVQIGMRGQADVYGLLNSKLGLIHIEIEFKSGQAKQSKDQKNWQTFIEKNNGFYFLVRDENDIHLIKSALAEML